MVKLRTHSVVPNRWIVDDGIEANGRVVETVKSSCKLEAFSDGPWIIFPHAYLSFVGNSAIINPNPTPIDIARREIPVTEAPDGA